MNGEGTMPDEGRRPRRSRCATQSRKQGMERLRRMSVEARIRTALTMRSRFSWLHPTVAER